MPVPPNASRLTESAWIGFQIGKVGTGLNIECVPNFNFYKLSGWAFAVLSSFWEEYTGSVKKMEKDETENNH